MKNKHASELAKKRWKKTTKKDRVAHAKKMNKASLIVRRNKAKKKKIELSTSLLA